MDRSERYGFNTALLYINIDQFSNVNDHYGEADGDVMIKSISRRLINKMQIKREMLDSNDRSFPDPVSMRNFRQFDDYFTAPIHGFGSADHYYQCCSSRQFLKHIERTKILLFLIDLEND